MEGNRDESVEKNSKFLVNISGYYMDSLDPRHTLQVLKDAVNARFRRADEFRELLGKRVELLRTEISLGVPDNDHQYVEGLKRGIMEISQMLEYTDMDSLHAKGGRRNFRRYSRRKRR